MSGEFALHLALIDPPMDGGVDAALDEVMARLPPVDYSFVNKTLEIVKDEPNAEEWKRCLLSAAWGNPLAMRSLQVHFLKRSLEAPYDGLYAYWSQAQDKTGIADFCRLNVVDKMEMIARAYHNRDTPILEDGRSYFTRVKERVARLKEKGYTSTDNPLVLALSYGCDLFEKTKLSPNRLAEFGDSLAELEEMKRVADLIVMCNRAADDTSALPSEVLAIREIERGDK